MFLYILLIIVGFIILIKSADWLVDNSASLAHKMGIPPIIIGLTIVAFGTSAPELIVNIISSLKGSSELVFGNIVGSNIANICLVIGLGALIMPLKIKSQTIYKEIPLMILGGLAFTVVSLDIINNYSEKIIHISDGIILLLFFFVFLYYIISNVLGSKDKHSKHFEHEIENKKISTSLFFITISLVGLFYGGKLVVDNAVGLATILGISEKLIGLTILAIGTSLPELITTVMAVIKKHSDIAIGGIVGSNIFNTTFIIGVSALIDPIVIESSVKFDFMVMIIAFLLLFLFSLSHKKIEKWEGFTLMTIYLAYMLLLIFRG